MEERKETVKEEVKEEAKSETTPLIEQANATAERIEAANKKQEELLNRQEEILARQALGGRSDAGETAQEKTVITPQEIAQKVLKGEINPLKEDGFI